MRHRRRNPDRTYYVKDSYSGHMEDFGSLRAAIRYAMKSGGFVHADDVVKHIYVERDESYIPLSVASRSTAKLVAEYANRNPMRRRNPAHASYGRWLFGLNFPANDPIIELAATWARGEDAPTSMIRFAYLSAERWTGAKDRVMRQAGKSVMNRLKGWLDESERAQFKHKPNTLASMRRYANPPKKLDRARHIRIAMNTVSSGWDYDLVSAEDSISDHEEEYGIQFTPDEKAYIMGHAKKGSHMETTNPRRRNPLPHEHAARLISPSAVVESSYRRKNVKGGSIGLLFAKLKRGKPGKRGGVMKLASVRFRAAHFTPAQARSWMREHGLRPILFEAATASRGASWRQESVRARRGRRGGRQRRRVA